MIFSFSIMPEDLVIPGGVRCHKATLVFIVQAVAALTVIIIALINLTVPGLCNEPNARHFWEILLSGTVGYIFPNPSLAGPS